MSSTTDNWKTRLGIGESVAYPAGIVGRTGRFAPAFALARGFGMLGATCWAFMVGPIEPVAWLSQTPREACRRYLETWRLDLLQSRAMLDRNKITRMEQEGENQRGNDDRNFHPIRARLQQLRT